MAVTIADESSRLVLAHNHNHHQPNPTPRGVGDISGEADR